MPSMVSDSSPEDSPGPAMTPNTRRLAMRSKGRDASGSKRKRAETNSSANQGPSRSRRRTREPEERDGVLSDDPDAYDPEQPIEERRNIQRKLRELGRDLLDNADEYLKGDSNGIHDLLVSANETYRNVKQTAEAVIDSRLLVTAADLSYKKTARITQGNHAEGVDVDEFMSKCLTFMRQGAMDLVDDAPELSSTQRHNRRRAARGQEGEDSDDESGDMLNWPYLGHRACLPCIGRSSVQGHILGPLSVEKKVRKFTKRSAPFRPNNLVEVRPEIIKAEELAKVENDMAVICRNVLDQLERIQVEAQENVKEAYETMEEDEAVEVMQQYGLRSNGGIDLLKFVINPKSFGQSVENMFYVSFLIRDGKVKIEYDDEDLPTIAPIDEDGDEVPESQGGSPTTGQDRHRSKSQAVFELDVHTWKEIVNTLGIKSSMIKHRREDNIQEPGASGWYS